MWYPQRSDRESHQTDQHVKNRWAPVEIFGPWLFAAYSLFYPVKVCAEHKSCLRSSINVSTIDFCPWKPESTIAIRERVPIVSRGTRQRMLRVPIGRQAPSASLSLESSRFGLCLHGRASIQFRKIPVWLNFE
jgi:hypothetical protein